jgi:hypothetical protein
MTIEARQSFTAKEIFLMAHPVLSLYETTAADEATPVQMAGKYGGAWEAFGAGMATVAIDTGKTDFNTIGKQSGAMSSQAASSGAGTSGAAAAGATGDTVLSESQMPYHQHSANATESSMSELAQLGAGSFSDILHVVVNGSNYPVVTDGLWSPGQGSWVYRGKNIRTGYKGSNVAHSHPSAPAHAHTTPNHQHTAQSTIQPSITVYRYRRTS